jgi:N-acetylmuramoyl-L-alanine amidase
MRKNVRWLIWTLLMILMMCQTAYAGSDITQKDVDEGVSFCKEYPVSLQVDGKAVNTDAGPVIIKERTLIPARAVFESMGATVTWNEASRLVEVSLGTGTVQLTIDSKSAVVNGKQISMEVPALVVGDRTMIPVRFVAESLNCGIGWDGDSRTVKVTSPAVDTKASVESVKVEEKNGLYRITIQGKSALKSFKSFTYDSPPRFGVDIAGASLLMEDGRVSADNEVFSGIRYSQFDDNTVRITIDLTKNQTGKVSFSNDQNTLYIDFDKNQSGSGSSPGSITTDGLSTVDWRAAEKLVIIDPGHGGKDTGSQAVQNGVEILNEKDINLDIALRLNRMLQAAGVNTNILRDADTSIATADRPPIANAANAFLYVSVHNNSFPENPSASGTEVLYNSKATESNYGLYSKHLAEIIQKEMVTQLGTQNRGAKSRPDLLVLNKTTMPAIIIEGAFLSNTGDLKLMLTDEFREKYALSAAKGIIQVLNESVSGQ